MTRGTLLRLVAAMIVLTVVISVGMVQLDWNGVAASEEAGPIDTLLNVMIVLSSFVFSVVMVMLGYSVWKYRAKPGDESDGEPVHGNTKLEIAWTVIPTLIVLFAIGYGWVILNQIEERAEADANPQVRVDVTSQQFKWTFDYPEEGITSDALHVPVDRQLELHLTALDVIHSFWVPEWRIKRDLVPVGPGGHGVDDTVLVTPNRIGSYSLVCAELCGIGHATMRAPVEVHTQEDWEAWVADQQEQQGGQQGQGAQGANGGTGNGGNGGGEGGGA